MPHSVYENAAKAGILMPMAAGNTISEEWAGKYPIIGKVRPEKWDGFHDFVLHDEMTRVGGIGYGLPSMIYVFVTDANIRVTNGLFGGVVSTPSEVVFCCSLSDGL